MSCGTTFSANSGNIGVQSATNYIWGVQLEIGSVATPLEKPEPRYDLSNCQRFYQGFQNVMAGGYSVAGSFFYADISFPETMRAAPTVIFGPPSNGNATGPTLQGALANHLIFYGQSTATGTAFVQANIMLSADL